LDEEAGTARSALVERADPMAIGGIISDHEVKWLDFIIANSHQIRRNGDINRC